MKTTETARLLDLARNFVPADLLTEVEQSFWVPQEGPHHKEGPFMWAHLWGVHQALEAVERGEFHSAVPDEVRPHMMAAMATHGEDAGRHVFLHDFKKGDCMTFEREEGHGCCTYPSLEAWRREVLSVPFYEGLDLTDPDDLAYYLRYEMVVKISYYQEVDGVKRAHGAVAAERLAERGDMSNLLIKGIETHEVAFLFGDRGGINLPLFHEHFGAWSEADVAYALLVNYADQMGSLKPDGQPDISDFRWLAKTWRAYVAFQVVKANLDRLRLDQHKATRLMDTLWKSTNAFQNETVDAVIARIRAECELRSFSEAQVRSALMPFVGLSSQLADAIVTDMTRDGKLSADTGKKLGGMNKAVRGALANLS